MWAFLSSPNAGPELEVPSGPRKALHGWVAKGGGKIAHIALAVIRPIRFGTSIFLRGIG